jgi:hypothetical protein
MQFDSTWFPLQRVGDAGPDGVLVGGGAEDACEGVGAAFEVVIVEKVDAVELELVEVDLTELVLLEMLVRASDSDSNVVSCMLAVPQFGVIVAYLPLTAAARRDSYKSAREKSIVVTDQVHKGSSFTVPIDVARDCVAEEVEVVVNAVMEQSPPVTVEVAVVQT